MAGSKPTLHDPLSRSHLHSRFQRRVIWGVVIAAVVLSLILIPLMVNDELRLDIARSLGVVPGGTGELVAGEGDGATLIVIPTEHDVEGTARTQLRFLAAFITRPNGGQLRLEPLNGGQALTVPIPDYDHVAASPHGEELYIAGPEGGAVIDVTETAVIAEVPAGASPDVSWDWQTAVWQRQTYICDRVSNTATWIGCFNRPDAGTYLAGDWQLDLTAYGQASESHAVMRGLGFQPIVGFTADDQWLYVYNERGIRRFDVAEVTGGDG